MLLAFLPSEELEGALTRIAFDRRGPNTIVTPDALMSELRRVREAGFAISNEELAYGLRSIAAPVLSREGRAVAAINLAVHSSMASVEDLAANLGERLRRAAADVSEHLGYR